MSHHIDHNKFAPRAMTPEAIVQCVPFRAGYADAHQGRGYQRGYEQAQPGHQELYELGRIVAVSKLAPTAYGIRQAVETGSFPVTAFRAPPPPAPGFTRLYTPTTP